MNRSSFIIQPSLITLSQDKILSTFSEETPDKEENESALTMNSREEIEASAQSQKWVNTQKMPIPNMVSEFVYAFSIKSYENFKFQNSEF